MQITIFGGSEPRPGDEAYTQAYLLGQALASRGHTVLTGGYSGIMEAVSRGAAEAGGHVIGVTCDEIEAWRPVKPNAWVKQEYRCNTLRQRVLALIEHCDAAITLPGGIGTLAETAEMWSHLQTAAITPRPLILVGTGWQETMRTFISSFERYIPDKYRQLIQLAADINTAVAIIDQTNLE